MLKVAESSGKALVSVSAHAALTGRERDTHHAEEQMTYNKMICCLKNREQDRAETDHRFCYNIITSLYNDIILSISVKKTLR